MSRHPLLFGSLVALVALAGFLSFLFSVVGFMKSSGAYTGAVSHAQSAPSVRAALGMPIRDGFWTTGTVNVSGPSGHAELAIPISGPKGKATVYVMATKSLGEWRFDRLVVQIDSTGQRLDLSRADPGPASR